MPLECAQLCRFQNATPLGHGTEFVRSALPTQNFWGEDHEVPLVLWDHPPFIQLIACDRHALRDKECTRYFSEQDVPAIGTAESLPAKGEAPKVGEL